MENKKEPKNSILEKKRKKLSEEAKVGVVVALSATVFFGGVLTINAIKKNRDVNDRPFLSVPLPGSNGSEKPVDEVYDPLKELLELPVEENIEMSRAFYDPNDDESTRMTAIVRIGGDESKTLRNYGVDYSATTSFDITSSFSGKVIEKSFIQDYGNVLVIEHESGVIGRYTSLGDVLVNKGQDIKQGDIIATAGESPYTSELEGKCLHFELKDVENKYINPTKSIGLKLIDL